MVLEGRGDPLGEFRTITRLLLDVPIQGRGICLGLRISVSPIRLRSSLVIQPGVVNNTRDGINIRLSGDGRYFPLWYR